MGNCFCIVKIGTFVFDAEQVFDMDVDFVLSGISSLFFKYIAV